MVQEKKTYRWRQILETPRSQPEPLASVTLTEHSYVQICDKFSSLPEEEKEEELKDLEESVAVRPTLASRLIDA